MSRLSPADRARDGRVVSSHGRDAVVEDENGARIHCRLQGRRLAVVCGDRVQWATATTEGGEGLVTELRPRRTTLARINRRGDVEPVAANLTQLVAVVAARPAPDFGLCDRYLAAAEWAGLQGCIVANKCDLPESGAELDTALADYARIGYTVVRTSKRDSIGVQALAPHLDRQTSVLVGQSGVGKSSLTNLLVPGVEAAVDEVTRASESGRHTTTSSTLYRLPTGGELIDSPGVRDFAPPLPAPRAVAGGFREIAALASHCRFADCLHDREPGCDVRAGIADGRVSARRHESYRRLMETAARLAARDPRIRR